MVKEYLVADLVLRYTNAVGGLLDSPTVVGIKILLGYFFYALYLYCLLGQPFKNL